MPALAPATPAPASHRNPDSPADQALSTIVDLLLQTGYGFTIPAWDGDAYMKINNALGALTNLTITAEGNVTWEYRSIHGTHIEPAALIVLTISLLDPDTTSPWPDLPLHGSRASILAAASHALFRYGYATSRRQPDPDAYTVLAVTSPALPARGTVEITDDGELSWQTRAPHHRDGGLTLPDIADSIACSLGRLQHIPSHA